VDVLFESAAAAFGSGVIGIVLTGAGFDGGRGLQRIKEEGGLIIVQNPDEAEAPSMPEHALGLVAADHVINLELLPALLRLLAGKHPDKGELQ
jgi:two-component system chemotaxis response regulator CheB